MFIHENTEIFQKREIAAALQIWNRAAVSLLDIRYHSIASTEALRGYRLPASTFLYTVGAKAEVFLNDTPYLVDRFGLFHAGKGTELTIRPVESRLEYYMVLYKAGEPPFHRREYLRLLTHTNPFQQQYGFVPGNPIFLLQLLQRMNQAWQNPEPLERFYEKTAFYQLVYEVYRALDKEDIAVLPWDGIVLAKRYLDEHYREEVSIQTISAVIGISESHLRRTFKHRYGKSPQDYLIQARLGAAKVLLQTETVFIKDIAAAVGFLDEFHFSKMFLKHVGMSPRDYRAKTTDGMLDYTMENLLPFSYNEQGLVSCDELKGKGAIPMLKQMKSKAIVAAAMSLMLMLSACGTAPATASGAESAPLASVAAQNSETTGTRTVSTSLGEIEVPIAPQRVVVQYFMGDVVSLGIEPVGVSDVYDGAAFSELVTDSVRLGWFPEWQAESVMALNPDLILVIDEAAVETFSKIAPTILIPYGDMTQNERITFFGEILNKQQEAAEALKTYEKNLEEAKAKLSEAGFSKYTVSVFEGGADAKMSVRGDQFGTGSILYKEIGVRAPAAVQENIIDKNSGGEQVSFEVLPQYSGDFIIRNTYDGMADLSSDAIWNSLPAVINNRVIGIEFGLSYYPDILSATAQLNYVTEELLRTSK